MKLIGILLEVLGESKTIQLGKEFFPQAEFLWKKAQQAYTHKNSGPIGDIKIFNPYTGKKVSINVEVVIDPNDRSYGSYNRSVNTIFISMENLDSKNTFIDILYHEAVHAIDPKSKNTKYYYDYDDYSKSPEEFDAVSSQVINTISRNLSKIGEIDLAKVKDNLKKLITDLLSSTTVYLEKNDYPYLRKVFNSYISFNQFFILCNNLKRYKEDKYLKKLAQRLSSLL